MGQKRPFCSRCLNAASIETKQMRSLIGRRYPWDTRIVCLYCNKETDWYESPEEALTIWNAINEKGEE